MKSRASGRARARASAIFCRSAIRLRRTIRSLSLQFFPAIAEFPPKSHFPKKRSPSIYVPSIREATTPRFRAPRVHDRRTVFSSSIPRRLSHTSLSLRSFGPLFHLGFLPIISTFTTPLPSTSARDISRVVRDTEVLR